MAVRAFEPKQTTYHFSLVYAITQPPWINSGSSGYIRNQVEKIEIKDRFGKAVITQEWFIVPIECIEEAVERIKDGSIVDYRYDTKSARLLKIK